MLLSESVGQMVVDIEVWAATDVQDANILVAIVVQAEMCCVVALSRSGKLSNPAIILRGIKHSTLVLAL